LGRRVEIGSARWRWSEGISCTRLVVWCDSRFGAGHMLSVAELNIRIQPWQLFGLLWEKAPTIDSVRLSGVALRIIRNEKGEWNFAEAAAAEQPQLRLLTVASAQVYIDDRLTKSSAVLADVNMTTGQFAGDESKFLCLTGYVNQTDNPAEFRVELLSNPTAAGGPAGQFTVRWHGLSLRTVRQFLPDNIRRFSSAGTVDGNAAVSFSPDGGYSVSGSADLADAEVARDGQEGPDARLKHARLAFDLHYVPGTGELDILKANLAGGGVSLSARGKCMLWGPVPWVSLEIYNGAISWAEFAETVPAVRKALAAFDVVAGRSAFSLNLKREGPKVSFSGTVDLADTLLVKKGIVKKPRHLAALIRFDSTYNSASRKLRLHEATLRSALGTATLAGDVTLPENGGAGAWDVLRFAEARGVGRVEDIARFLNVFPVFQRLPAGFAASGPVDFDVALSPQKGGAAVAMNFDASAVKLTAGDETIKPADVLCKGSAKLLIPAKMDRVEMRPLKLRLAEAEARWDGWVELPEVGSDSREVAFAGNLRLLGLARLASLLP
ncbi:MAG: hypothetical protein QGD94_10985, partial [Planctomycetia bacterium]|nr:hypothetical protein [Planctomycetia bacterium]